MAIKARKNQDLADDSKLYRATDAAAAPAPGIGKATKQLPQNWDDGIDAPVGTTPAVLPKADVPDLNKTPYQAALAGAQSGGAGAGIGMGTGAGPGMSAAPQTAVTPATPAAEQANTGWGVSNTPFRTATWSYSSAPRYRMSEWDRRMRSALGRAENMEFAYDRNTDPVWQAYLDQYTREGRRAMEDTLGRVSAQTGGLASSYGVSAAAQQRNDYAQRLTDKIPELYQQAYQRYLQEYQRQMGLADTYRGLEDRNYSRWSNDTLGQYNTDRDLSYRQWRDETGDARTAEDTAYERAWNEAARARDWAQEDEDRAWTDAVRRNQYGDPSGLQAMGLNPQTVYAAAISGRGGGGGGSDAAAEEEGPKFTAKDYDWARDYVTSVAQGKADPSQWAMAQRILNSGGWELGAYTAPEKAAEASPQLDAVANRIDLMQRQGSTSTEIADELAAALKAKSISSEEYNRLYAQYVGNPGEEYVFKGKTTGATHDNGKPKSGDYDSARLALQKNSGGLAFGAQPANRNAMKNLILNLADRGLLYEYEYDMLMDEFGLDPD